MRYELYFQGPNTEPLDVNVFHYILLIYFIIVLFKSLNINKVYDFCRKMFSVTMNYLIYSVSLQALELLPANTKVRDVLTFLENVLEGKATEKRENQVLRSLLYAEHLQVGNYTFYGSSECVYFLFYIICFPSVTQV